MGNSAFKIAKEIVQGKVPVTVLHVGGWLDAQSDKQFLAEARAVYDEGVRHLVIDLADVDTMTSAGIRSLQMIYKMYTTDGDASVKLCSAPPQVYHVLNMTGFLQSMKNYETLQAAIDSF